MIDFHKILPTATDMKSKNYSLCTLAAILFLLPTLVLTKRRARPSDKECKKDKPYDCPIGKCKYTHYQVTSCIYECDTSCTEKDIKPYVKTLQGKYGLNSEQEQICGSMFAADGKGYQIGCDTEDESG